MTFNEHLAITLIDKGLLALVLAVVAFVLHKSLETFKAGQARLVEAFKAEENYRSEMRRLQTEKELDFRERQLTEFYWPLFIRLEVDTAVWGRILDKRAEDPRNRALAEAIEKDFILPNHDVLLELLRSKIHLSEDDPQTFELAMRYVRHIAIYKALRVSGDNQRFPYDLGEPWPADFAKGIRETARRLQAEYHKKVAALAGQSPITGPVGTKPPNPALHPTGPAGTP